MRTICVGRFLLDIPASASVEFGPASTPYETDRLEGQGANIDPIIAGYLDDLKKRDHLVYGELREPDSMLGKVVDGPVPGQKILYDLSSEDDYHIRSFIKIGKDLFQQSIITFPQHAADHLSQLTESTSRFTHRDNNAIPAESGFCIDGALVRDAKHSDVERVQVGIRLREFPDVYFSIEMIRKSYKVESDALEPRLKDFQRGAKELGLGAWYASIKTLRRGKRALKPWAGYEALTRKPPLEREGDHHDFNFVALGEPKNIYIPTIDMALKTGMKGYSPGAIRPSVTDEEAVYIWDRLTSALRVRPITAPAK